MPSDDEEKKKTTAAKLASEAVAYVKAKISQAPVTQDTKAEKQEAKQQEKPQETDAQKEENKFKGAGTIYNPWVDLQGFDGDLGEKLVNPTNKFVTDVSVKKPFDLAKTSVLLPGNLKALDIAKDEFANKDLKTRNELIDKKYDAQVAKLKDSILPKTGKPTEAQQEEYDGKVKKLDSAKAGAQKYAENVDGIKSGFEQGKKVVDKVTNKMSSIANKGAELATSALNKASDAAASKAGMQSVKDNKNEITTPRARK